MMKEHDMPVPDAELLRRYARHGDKSALEELLARHIDMLSRIARRTTRNDSDADDAVQSALVRIMKSADQYRGGEGTGAWMAKIVVTECHNLIKKAVRRRRREDTWSSAPERMDEAGSEHDGDTAEIARRTAAAVENLPERYRLPVWLHHYEGLTFRDIARALSISESAARTQASRGVAMARQALARTGTPVATASLVALFGTLPAEGASSALKRSVGPIVESGGTKGLSPTAAGLADQSRSAVWLKPVLAASLLASAGGIIVGARLWQPLQRPVVLDPVARSEPTPVAGHDYRWDFHSAESARDFLTVVGEWEFVPHVGRNGTGSMETRTDLFSVMLDVPISVLPVKVTWRIAWSGTQAEADFTSVWSWASYRYAFHFFGLSDVHDRIANPPPDGFSRWYERTAYVSEDFLYEEYEGRRHRILYAPRTGESRLRLYVRGRSRIDQIVLRSISPQELPDVSAYVNAARAIPSEWRDGRRVPLPEIKPGKHHSLVEVAYEPGR